MIDMDRLLDALHFLLRWAAAALLLALLPFVFCSLFNSEEPRQDEQWWLECGYLPLDASSMGAEPGGVGASEAHGSEAGEDRQYE